MSRPGKRTSSKQTGGRRSGGRRPGPERRRLFSSGFGVAVLGCLALACWALVSGGLFNGPVARELRVSSVYTAPGIHLDEAAAERIIGNRRLVVAFLAPGADLAETCDDLDGPADGTIGLILSTKGDDFDKYPCFRFGDYDFGDENFDEAFVAEQLIGDGIDGFTDQPLDALKVAVVNYDQLADSGVIPPDARTVSPSLPRYVVAATAVGAVVAGALALYLVGRRAAKVAVQRRERRDAEEDADAELSAAAAVLAQRIIDLDTRYARERGPGRRTDFTTGYRKLVADYTRLLPELDAPARDLAGLQARVDALLDRARGLTRSAPASAGSTKAGAGKNRPT